ncbi:hypothetical protein [Burkholderia gladioli]|uniref:hypothetical protein n=1 Tax=Burkholderia gladioli TaxID=28095 RepID=UPI00163E0FDE|nr:hypothetical protein [Burkholderia gladioli]
MGAIEENIFYLWHRPIKFPIAMIVIKSQLTGYIFAAAFTTVFLCACSKSPSPLDGTYQCSEGGDYHETYIFHSDGTAKRMYQNSMQNVEQDGTFNINGDILNITFNKTIDKRWAEPSPPIENTSMTWTLKINGNMNSDFTSTMLGNTAVKNFTEESKTTMVCKKI